MGTPPLTARYARAAAMLAGVRPGDPAAADATRATLADMLASDPRTRAAVRAVAIADRRRDWAEPAPDAERTVDAVLGVEAADWPDAPHLPGPPAPDGVPVDVLPPALRDHVTSVAAATQTPVELPAMLALAAVSTAVRGRADVVVDGRGWRELVAIYTAIVLPPGSRKSPVYAHMMRPLSAWEAERAEEVGPAHRRALDRVEVARKALDGAIRSAATAQVTPEEVEATRRTLDDAEAAVPTLPRLYAADATPEALARLMADQGGPMALLAPEADPFGIADGRYTDAARLDELLRAWSGEQIRVDRIGRPTVHVDRPALTMGITMQPEVLEGLRHARAFRGRGLMGRILWAAPSHGIGSRATGQDVPGLDPVAAARYARTLRTLLDATTGESVNTVTAYSEVALTPEAVAAIYAYEAEVEADMADGARLAGVRDWAAKAVGQAIRLAALLELAARAEDGRPLWTEPVGTWAVEGGIRLARALTTHALHLLAELEMDRRTADVRYVLRRARELPEGGTLRDLHRACHHRASIESAEDLAELVADLSERGCVRLVHAGVEGPGRPSSPMIELHPALRGHSPIDGDTIDRKAEMGVSVDSVHARPGLDPARDTPPDDVFGGGEGAS